MIVSVESHEISLRFFPFAENGESPIRNILLGKRIGNKFSNYVYSHFLSSSVVKDQSHFFPLAYNANNSLLSQGGDEVDWHYFRTIDAILSLRALAEW